MSFSKLYKSYQYEMESMSTTSSASTINHALVAKLNSKQAVVSTQNFYDALDNAEVIVKETNDEIVPKTVIPEVKTFAISFANIVKKSPDDFKQEQFNKMMEMETKDCWDDY
jgi:hypothetical protein